MPIDVESYVGKVSDGSGFYGLAVNNFHGVGGFEFLEREGV